MDEIEIYVGQVHLHWLYEGLFLDHEHVNWFDTRIGKTVLDGGGNIQAVDAGVLRGDEDVLAP